jgi:eukaryotic-like serine/threonine-protein kinase
LLAVGTVIGGRFRIDQVLGAGGMGIVVAATHLELGHRVAIKLLRDEMAGNPTIVDRFLREARSVVNLRTEHVCRVTDVGRTDTGAPYIVMELLEGADLQRIVARQPLPPALAVGYIVQACVGLAEAHAAGIIHRDLKPANLFVTRRPDGTPLLKVLDFGIAKALTDTGANLTHTQGAMGSPGYMSPEQLQSARDVDVRTDIWALGITLYQLLSARLPFTGTTLAEVAVRVATDAPAPLDVDPQLRAIVLRCLDKVQDRRYPDVVALATELAPFGGPAAVALVPTIRALAYRAGTFITSQPPVVPTGTETRATASITGPARRARWPIVVAAIAVLAVAGVGLAVLRTGAPPVPRDAAVVATVRVDAMTLAADAPVAEMPVDAGSDADDDDFELPEMPEIASVNAMIKDACKGVNNKTDPSGMGPMICLCAQRDAKRALALWPHVTKYRDLVRNACKPYGVKLP